MNDDYLWDKSGEPDAEIQRLESTLARFRHNRPAPPFPEHTGLLDRLRSWFLVRRLVAVAVAVALVAVGVWLIVRRSNPSPTSWQVARLAGTPVVGAKRVQDTGRLAVGQSLVTDSASRARIDVGNIGQVDVEPNSRLRLVAARSTEDRLALDRGTIHAFISAPPRLFFVDTPSAQAIDLGCAYTLQVDDQGVGLLRVTFGWVELETRGQQSLIPAGAAAISRPGVGPGTPYFEDASEAFRAALQEIDFGEGGPENRSPALRTLLAEARPRDGFTLLNLLRTYRGLSEAERALVYDRLADLIPPPQGITREGIARGDDYMVGVWWDLMGVGHPRKK